MKRLLNTRSLNVGLFLVGVLIWCSVNGGSAFAFSATITTSNSIDLEVSSVGDGVSIHSMPINITSDCRSGYNLSVATPSGSDLYKYDNGAQSGNTAVFTAVDGVTSLGSGDNANKWGYTLASDASKNTTFLPLSVNGSVIKDVSETASADSDIDDTFSIKYGVKVDNSVEPGNYRMAGNGAIVYYLTMDTTCTQYTLLFDPNGGTVADGGNNPTQNIQLGEPTKLASSDALKAPVGASYIDSGNNTINGQADKLWTFWGWNTEIDGSGDWYKERELVEDLAEATQTFTLYAQWKQATLADLTIGTQVGDEKVIDHNTMQDMSPAACYNSANYVSTSEYTSTTLIDKRGRNTTGSNPESPDSYTIAKLADGLCWMTQNLNLGRSGSDGPNGDGTVTLTSDDTDLASDTTFTLPASNNSFPTANNATAYTTPVMYRDSTYGVYYSWAAALASTTNYTVGETNVATSICPKNWDLPARLQYDNLKTKAGLTTSNAYSAPFNFYKAGYKNGTSAPASTTAVYLWTSTTKGTTAYYSSATANATSANNNKRFGYNIRCVASNGKATINYDGNGTVEYPTTGSVASQTNVEINSTKTATNGFTRNGFGFTGWNTAADGSGTAIADSTAISNLALRPGETITLYAQWVPQYTITYVNNCLSWVGYDGNCTNDTDIATLLDIIDLNSSGNGSKTLRSYSAWSNLAGWKIAGWNTEYDGEGTEYAAGSSYAVTGQNPGDSITLYAHWVQVYSIQYDGNDADNPDGMGTTDQSTGVKSVKQTNVSEGDPVILLASNFKKAEYGFAGWSTDPDAYTHFTDNDNTNDPIIYGPMETISAPAYPTNGTNIITMYAVWVEAEKDGSNNPVYLQDFTTGDCNALTKANFNSTTGVITPGSVIALTDKRDNMVYAVARLADDNCWMIENLRLDNQYTMGQNQNDSSVTNASLSQGYGGTPGTYGSFVGLANSESANYSSSTTSNTVYKSSLASPTDTYDPSISRLEDIGTTGNPVYRFPRYNNSNTNNLVGDITYTQNFGNPRSPVDSGTNYRTSSNVYSFGNYYSWAAAMANTNNYTNATSEATGTSICPAGWHLPSGNGSTKDFTVLSVRYGATGGNQGNAANGGDVISERFRAFPNNFLYSGLIKDSSIRNRGANGYYWSRTSSSSNSAYRLTFGATLFSPIGGDYRSTGLSVRCIMD